MRDRSLSATPHLCVGDSVAGWRLVRQLPALIADTASYVGVAEAGTGMTAASEHWRSFDSQEPQELLQRRITLAESVAGQEALVRDAQVRHLLRGEFIRSGLELLRLAEARVTVAPLEHDLPYSSLVSLGTERSPGELVTLLVPLAETIALAHDAGLSHGSLSLRNCRFDACGHPWFEDWSASADLADLSGMRRDLAKVDDLRAVGRVCEAMLALSTDPVPFHLLRLLGTLSGHGSIRDQEALLRLIDALFAWASPEPLRLEPPRPASARPEAVTRAQPALRAVADDEPLTPSTPPRVSARTRDRLRMLQQHAAQVRPQSWLLLAGAGSLVALASTLLQ